MRSAVLLPAAVLFVAACGGAPTATQPSASATPTAEQRSPTPAGSPTPAPPQDPLLVFLKAGALSLVWPDGTVSHEVQTAYSTVDAGSNQFDSSDAVLISRDYAVRPCSPATER